MTRELRYDFIKNIAFICISLLIGASVVPFLPGEPKPETLSRALLIFVFGTVFISLHAIDWYRNEVRTNDTNG